MHDFRAVLVAALLGLLPAGVPAVLASDTSIATETVASSLGSYTFSMPAVSAAPLTLSPGD